jgi:hypothetical protein
MKLSLRDQHVVCVSVNSRCQRRMSEPVLMKLSVCIMAPEPIATAYCLNPSHKSVLVYVSSRCC